MRVPREAQTVLMHVDGARCERRGWRERRGSGARAAGGAGAAIGAGLSQVPPRKKAKYVVGENQKAKKKAWCNLDVSLRS